MDHAIRLLEEKLSGQGLTVTVRQRTRLYASLAVSLRDIEVADVWIRHVSSTRTYCIRVAYTNPGPAYRSRRPSRSSGFSRGGRKRFAVRPFAALVAKRLREEAERVVAPHVEAILSS